MNADKIAAPPADSEVALAAPMGAEGLVNEAERRRHHRLRVQLPVRVEHGSLGISDEIVGDISQGGCMLYSLVPAKSGDVLSLQIAPHASTPVSLNGVVVRCHLVNSPVLSAESWQDRGFGSLWECASCGEFGRYGESSPLPESCPVCESGRIKILEHGVHAIGVSFSNASPALNRLLDDLLLGRLDMTEQKREARLRLGRKRLPVTFTLRPQDASKAYNASIQDVSRGGLLILTGEPLVVDDEVRLRLVSKTDNFELVGSVAHRRATVDPKVFAVGIRLALLKGGDREPLDRFMHSLAFSQERPLRPRAGFDWSMILAVLALLLFALAAFLWARS